MPAAPTPCGGPAGAGRAAPTSPRPPVFPGAAARRLSRLRGARSAPSPQEPRSRDPHPQPATRSTSTGLGAGPAAGEVPGHPAPAPALAGSPHLDGSAPPPAPFPFPFPTPRAPGPGARTFLSADILGSWFSGSSAAWRAGPSGREEARGSARPSVRLSALRPPPRLRPLEPRTVGPGGGACALGVRGGTGALGGGRRGLGRRAVRAGWGWRGRPGHRDPCDPGPPPPRAHGPRSAPPGPPPVARGAAGHAGTARDPRRPEHAPAIRGPPTPLRAEKLAGESHAHPTPGKVQPLRAGRGTSGRISARGSCTRWSRLHPRAHAAEGTREPVCVLRAGEGVHPAAVGPWNGAALSTRAFPWRGHVRWCLRDEGAAARPQAPQTGTLSS